MTTEIGNSLVSVLCPNCPFCGKASYLRLPRAQVQAFQLGMLVQRAFPGLPADQRELLISGTHPECWDRFMKDPDA